MFAGHLHKMGKSAGVLFMKRIVCTDTSCAVHKVGKCFDVGQDVFTYTSHIEYNTDDLVKQRAQENTEWATLIVEQLKAGNATECATTGTLAQTISHNIFEVGLKGY
jgi:hypothetical protein